MINKNKKIKRIILLMLLALIGLIPKTYANEDYSKNYKGRIIFQKRLDNNYDEMNKKLDEYIIKEKGGKLIKDQEDSTTIRKKHKEYKIKEEDIKEISEKIEKDFGFEKMNEEQYNNNKEYYLLRISFLSLSEFFAFAMNSPAIVIAVIVGVFIILAIILQIIRRK